jgi:hypothetical protein
MINKPIRRVLSQNWGPSQTDDIMTADHRRHQADAAAVGHPPRRAGRGAGKVPDRQVFQVGCRGKREPTRLISIPLGSS